MRVCPTPMGDLNLGASVQMSWAKDFPSLFTAREQRGSCSEKQSSEGDPSFLSSSASLGVLKIWLESYQCGSEQTHYLKCKWSLCLYTTLRMWTAFPKSLIKTHVFKFSVADHISRQTTFICHWIDLLQVWVLELLRLWNMFFPFWSALSDPSFSASKTTPGPALQFPPNPSLL